MISWEVKTFFQQQFQMLAETPTENFRDCQTSGSSASLNECSVLKIHQATDTLLI